MMRAGNKQTSGSGNGFARSRAAKRLTVCALAAVAAAILLASLAIGRYGLGPAEIVRIIAGVIGGDPSVHGEANVLITIRLPRVAAALLVGASLSEAGCAYQGIFKNPMVSPDILGASAGACFGAALGILFSFGGAMVELAAFAAGILAVLATYALSAVIGRKMRGVLVLVLSGLVVGNIFQAGVSAVKFLADPNSQLPEITFWLMGGLSSAREEDVLLLLATFAVGSAGLATMRWKLNVMTLGDAEALSLGIDVKRCRVVVITCSTLLTAASVAVAGMVGWVGLIVPHLARFLVGADHRYLLPASTLMGGAFLMLVDDLCRSIYTTEIPLSILTALVGAPLFVYLICRGREVR